MLRLWLGSALFGAVPAFIALQSHYFAKKPAILQDGTGPSILLIVHVIFRFKMDIIQRLRFAEQTLHPTVCCCKRCRQDNSQMAAMHRTEQWNHKSFGMVSSWLSVSAANYMADLCHWLIWIVCRCFGFTILLPRITVGAFIEMFRVYSHCCWIHSQSQCFSHGRVGCILHQCWRIGETPPASLGFV